jgi:hypothetical protein
LATYSNTTCFCQEGYTEQNCSEGM